jgi:hypothetical protein
MNDLKSLIDHSKQVMLKQLFLTLKMAKNVPEMAQKWLKFKIPHNLVNFHHSVDFKNL